MTTNFSKDSDLKLARQLYLNADHFLYPLAASGCAIYVAYPLSTWSPSAMSWKIESISLAWFVIWHPEDVPKENAVGAVFQC